MESSNWGQASNLEAETNNDGVAARRQQQQNEVKL
jgi:hypothetical protein